MPGSHQQLFQALPRRDAPDGLEEQVVTALHCVARREATVFTGLAVVAAGGLVGAAVTLGNALVESGFLEYVALAVSGGVAGSWRELGLALSESLPLLGVAATLGALALTLWAAARAAASWQPTPRMLFA